uniref:Uncharacterized protein n=1 Tax=Arundo donax TaxID=35708 RepID=A0A0A9AGP4_ARUDO
MKSLLNIHRKKGLVKMLHFLLEYKYHLRRAW